KRERISAEGGTDARGIGELHHAGVPEAARQVIVHHAGGLQIGVHRAAADVAEAARAHVARDGIREYGARRHVLQPQEAVLYRAAVHEAPQVGGEAAELLLHLEEAAGVVDRRHDLLAVTHDAAGPQQLFRARVAEGRDPGRVEVLEGDAVAVALAQDGGAGQA